LGLIQNQDNLAPGSFEIEISGICGSALLL